MVPITYHSVRRRAALKIGKIKAIVEANSNKAEFFFFSFVSCGKRIIS